MSLYRRGPAGKVWRGMRYRRPLAVFLLIGAVLSIEWLWLRFDRADPPYVPSLASGDSTGAYGAAVAGGDFSLIAHGGAEVSLASFDGRFLLLSFGYTHCPDICPLTLDSLSQVMERLGPLSEQLQPLFVTLDPERDSPAVLADYLSHFDPRIVGLSGSPTQVRAIADSYGVRYAKAGDGPDYGIDHSAAFYLASPEGRVLQYFRHDIDPADLAQRIGATLNAAALGLTSVKDAPDAAAL